jgi:hypothetical protein
MDICVITLLLIQICCVVILHKAYSNPNIFEVVYNIGKVLIRICGELINKHIFASNSPFLEIKKGGHCIKSFKVNDWKHSKPYIERLHSDKHLSTDGHTC